MLDVGWDAIKYTIVLLNKQQGFIFSIEMIFDLNIYSTVNKTCT